jgi:hypothetical protein
MKSEVQNTGASINTAQAEDYRWQFTGVTNAAF